MIFICLLSPRPHPRPFACIVINSHNSPERCSFLFHFYGWYNCAPVLLPGKSHGQRSLVGYSPWGLKELDTTEASLSLSQLCFSPDKHLPEAKEVEEL